MKRTLVLIVVFVALGAGAAGYWFGYRPAPGAADVLVASGTVEATEGQFGFTAPGRIDAILVREGDRIRAGTELARLDPAELDARRAQAVAHVNTGRAQLAELERGSRPEELAQGRAAVDAVNERLLDAERDLDRTRRLFEGGAVARESLDKAAMSVEVARSQQTQTGEQLRLLEQGPRREKIDAQRAQVAQARAAVQAIDAALANTLIVAPFDATVTVRHREPGEIVSPGAAVLTLMNADDRWVRIYVPANRIGAVRMGMQVSITSDTFPEKTYPGEVVFIASQAEFTPKSVQTTEERVKLVYAVKIRILDDPDLELKPGMPADVRLAFSGA
jgi:HlyD family secretion protein